MGILSIAIITTGECLPGQDAGVFPVNLTQISEAGLEGPRSVLTLDKIFKEHLTSQTSKALNISPDQVCLGVQSPSHLQSKGNVRSLNTDKMDHTIPATQSHLLCEARAYFLSPVPEL